MRSGLTRSQFPSVISLRQLDHPAELHCFAGAHPPRALAGSCDLLGLSAAHMEVALYAS